MYKNKALHILIVEDLPTDAELAVRELQKSGIELTYLRVDAKETFLAALDDFHPDIIISDYAMPQFDGMQALKLSLAHDPLLPFIILTGSMNEDTAVACMKAGATDYVLKGHIGRLPFAVKEALEGYIVRKEKEAAIQLLRESEERYKRITAGITDYLYSVTVKDGKSIETIHNEACLTVTGYTAQEFEADPYLWINMVVPEEREQVASKFTTMLKGTDIPTIEHKIICKDGSIRWVSDTAIPKFDSQEQLVSYDGVIKDITERKQAEENIKQALIEKETLLRELYHRTRNNMQVIISMLSIQANISHNMLVKKVVSDTNSRILSMSLVHQKLYESQNLSNINLKDYCEDLIRMLTSSTIFPLQRISIQISVEPISVNIDTAMPCGLVLHELLSNAFKHAFPDDVHGEVILRLKQPQDDTIELEVSDNGIGVPQNFDFHKTDTIGFQIVHGIVERQLCGKVWFESAGGLTCHVCFQYTQTIARI